MTRFSLTALAIPAILFFAAAQAASAADVFPVKAYTKPDELIVVKFVNEKGDEGKKAVETLGAEAAKLESLFTPAAAADINDAFKILSPTGEEQKLEKPAANPDGTVDLSAAFPKLKDGGTFFVVWKDAPPLVIEILFNPGRGPRELAKIKANLDQL